MPWSQTSPMDQRTQFIADYLRDSLSITEICQLYEVSRKTGYKWIERYLRRGPAGLEEHSRQPHRSPNQTPDEIVAAILDTRRRHPFWGAKKLLTLLHKGHPRWPLPGRSTVCDILSRHGLVPKRRTRRRIVAQGAPGEIIKLLPSSSRRGGTRAASVGVVSGASTTPAAHASTPPAQGGEYRSHTARVLADFLAERSA